MEPNTFETIGIQQCCILPNTTTGQEEGGDFTQPIHGKTWGEKNGNANL